MAKKSGIGSHQSAKMKNDEWLTDPKIIKALGEFDLDPCSPINRPWPTAKVHHYINTPIWERKWHGRVWLNPPYGQETGHWLEKLKYWGNGIALIFARTETDLFFKHIWDDADAIFFLKGRLYFYHVDGTRAKYTGGAPSVLIAYGKNNVRALEKAQKSGTIKGKMVYSRR